MQYVLDVLQWRHMSVEASQLTGKFVQQLVQYSKKTSTVVCYFQ